MSDKMADSITDGPRYDDEVVIPEVEFIRVVPLQVGSLQERTASALNDYHNNDEADVDEFVYLLNEWLNRYESVSADVDFAGLDGAIDNLKKVIKEQAE